MSAYTRMEEECDALEEKVAGLEREIRLMRQQYFRRVEERDELLAALERIAKGGWHTVTPASSIANEAIAKAKGW